MALDPVGGADMIIRVVTGIRAHFEARFVEWVMAICITFWGWTLIGDGTAWSNKQAWAGMLRIASEEAWGGICIAAGGLWLLALTINGTFANTWYSRYSPVVRGLAAWTAAMIWFQVYTSVVAAGTSGSGIYPLPLALSIWCVFHAWRDIGRGTRTHGNHLG
jgi:hypothetical protein